MRNLNPEKQYRKMKNKLYYIYLVILTALVAGCQDEAMFTAEDMEEEMGERWYYAYDLDHGEDSI